MIIDYKDGLPAMYTELAVQVNEYPGASITSHEVAEAIMTVFYGGMGRTHRKLGHVTYNALRSVIIGHTEGIPDTQKSQSRLDIRYEEDLK